MLIKRIISSLVLTSILLATIFIFPRPVVALVAAVLIGLGLWEFYVISEAKGFNPFKIFGISMGILLSVITYIAVSYKKTINPDSVISVMLFIILFLVIIKYSFKKDGMGVIANSAVTMLGILYISFLFTFIIKIRYIPNIQEGKGWVMALFVITKFSDISAYFFGTKFGKHKLIPRISAKKTIEGSIAGVIGAVLVSLLLKLWFLVGVSWAFIIILGILMSVMGQVGDIIESLIKRDAKVKDSGTLVPGMGGVLDFMDSLLFTGPVMYIFLTCARLHLAHDSHTNDGMKRVIILGSTGSIGESTLDVVRKNLGKISVCGLSTKTNVELLKKQIEEFKPDKVSVGMEGLLDLVRMDADMVVSALVGAVGLAPTIEAIRHGKDIALANKEVLVMAGEIVMLEAKKAGVNIIPIDSEHSALMQCLWKRDPREVNRLILTASGGPFYSRPDLTNITPELALQHPTWQMGPKVTVDSATLMNKGFEVIEASYLFGIPIDKIEVVIHPESIVHAMVEFIDGSTIALMHMPDMRIPIQYALSWPSRWDCDYGVLDLTKIETLNFTKPDTKRFPALELAYRAGTTGGTMPAVLSAADEVCVERFLKGEIGFEDIVSAVKDIMNQHDTIKNPVLEDIFAVDQWVREKMGVKC